MSFRPLTYCAVLFAAVAVLAGGARAAEVRPAPANLDPTRPAPVTLSASVFEPVTAGYLTPSFGGAILGVLRETPNNLLPLAGASPAPSQDFAASYKAGFGSSQLGVFGGYNSRANLFEAAPTTGWNFGASVGYAGFYLRAGVSSDAAEATAHLLNDTNKGWLAGVGYEFGAVDVRVTYMTAQPTGLTDRVYDNNRLWMIGGIFQLTPRFRLNADAFTGGHDLRGLANVFSATSNAAAPQGTGGRVGVQLQF